MKLSCLILVLCLSWMGTTLAQPETVIAVELTGGAHAGRYALEAPESYCLYGTGNGDDWRTLYGTTESGPAALSTVLLQIPETTPAESGSADFFFSAGLGEYSTDDYVEYILDPPNGNGTGTVTVQWDGRKRAVLSIVGQTADDVGMNATVTCNNVLRVGGEALGAGELGELDFGTGLPAGAAATGSLELTIGDKSYSLMTNAEIADCAPDSFETGDFFYTYYPPGVTSLELYAPSLEAALQGTDNFGFGFDTQPVYRPGEGGSGSLTATRDGQQITLVADVTTADGTPIRATIHCPLPN